MIYGLIKYSSSSELKRILFPDRGNSISYVTLVVSLNVFDVRSSSHKIKLWRAEL